MVDNFLCVEYHNMDFNADKSKQNEAVRDPMARKCSSVDVNLLRPETTTAITKDVEESKKKELVEKVKSEKVLITKGDSRVMKRCCNNKI